VPTRNRLAVAELLGGRVRLRPEDASALVRSLCLVATAPSIESNEPVIPPFGPEQVWLGSNGDVHLTPGVYPTVADLGLLLERLLAEVRRQGPTRIPPGLVIATARATGQIDAAPIPSPRALARALERFDPPERDAALRALFDAGVAAFAAERSPTQARSHFATRRPLRLALLATGGFSAGVIAALLLQPKASVPRPTDSTEVTIATSGGEKRQQPERPMSAQPPRITAPRSTGQLRPPPRNAAPVRSAVESRVGTSGRFAAEPLVGAAAADADAAFSPSFDAHGSAVFFHAQIASGSALKRAERDDSGELHVITIVDDAAKNYHVQLSPDGKSVAFDSDRDGVRGVYLAKANGTEVRRVSGPGYAAVPTWSPEGQRLAFLRAEPEKPRVWNLWVQELNTGEMTRVTNHSYGQVWGGAWFQDGRRLAYSHEDRLIVFDLVSRRSTTYSSPRPGQLVRTPAVSPDGRWIIFQVFRDGAWLLDLNTGSMSRVLDDASAEEFTWAPDGQRVAFHSRRNGTWGLWIMAAR
jgi:WD40-like Beta Propeller Repeat/Dipeptidyl peptidase IV (DPP IV) N-terminal region